LRVRKNKAANCTPTNPIAMATSDNGLSNMPSRKPIDPSAVTAGAIEFATDPNAAANGRASGGSNASAPIWWTIERRCTNSPSGPPLLHDCAQRRVELRERRLSITHERPDSAPAQRPEAHREPLVHAVELFLHSAARRVRRGHSSEVLRLPHLRHRAVHPFGALRHGLLDEGHNPVRALLVHRTGEALEELVHRRAHRTPRRTRGGDHLREARHKSVGPGLHQTERALDVPGRDAELRGKRREIVLRAREQPLDLSLRSEQRRRNLVRTLTSVVGVLRKGKQRRGSPLGADGVQAHALRAQFDAPTAPQPVGDAASSPSCR
jgi:hypothetical protein